MSIATTTLGKKASWESIACDHDFDSSLPINHTGEGNIRIRVRTAELVIAFIRDQDGLREYWLSKRRAHYELVATGRANFSRTTSATIQNR